MAAKTRKQMTIAKANMQSFRKAVEKYRRDAGGLFEPLANREEDAPEDWSHNDELRCRLDALLELLKDNKMCPARTLDANSRRWMVRTLTLDSCIEYERRGEDGKKTVTRTEKSIETIRRNASVATFYECCVHAAALAKEKSAPLVRQMFVELLADLEMVASLRGDDTLYMCSRREAEGIVGRFERGLLALWCELYVQDEERGNGGNAKADVELGADAQKIVKACNFETGALTFKNGTTYRLPSHGKAREILEKLLCNSDPDGYVRLERNWHTRFVRKDGSGNLDFKSPLTRLRYYIYDEPVAKRRRGTGRFRLEDRIDAKVANFLSSEHGAD